MLIFVNIIQIFLRFCLKAVLFFQKVTRISTGTPFYWKLFVKYYRELAQK